MAISPKQAADAATTFAAEQAASVKALAKSTADMLDTVIEMHLKTHRRAVLGKLRVPSDPDAVAMTTVFTGVLEELEQRYREAGWTTKLAGDVLTIEPPVHS
jgi:hypothetical protein